MGEFSFIAPFEVNGELYGITEKQEAKELATLANPLAQNKCPPPQPGTSERVNSTWA